MNERTSYFSIPSVITAVTVGVFVGVVATHAAWGNPTANPPGNNTAAPVDMSVAAQGKEGPLSLGNVFSVKNTASFLGNMGLNLDNSYANALLIPYGNVGIGTATPTAVLDVEGSVKMWGTRQIRAINTRYVPTSDGFVVALIFGSGGTVCRANAYYCTESACLVPGAGATYTNSEIPGATLSFPVYKGLGWRVDVELVSGSGSCGGQPIYYPLGSGTSVLPPPPPPPPPPPVQPPIIPPPGKGPGPLEEIPPPTLDPGL